MTENLFWQLFINHIGTKSVAEFLYLNACMF